MDVNIWFFPLHYYILPLKKITIIFQVSHTFAVKRECGVIPQRWASAVNGDKGWWRPLFSYRRAVENGKVQPESDP
jgi:hypothetical protein